MRQIHVGDKSINWILTCKLTPLKTTIFYTDQCQNIRCHEFANCQNGRCQCNAGYEGDGYWECKSIKSGKIQR